MMKYLMAAMLAVGATGLVAEERFIPDVNFEGVVYNAEELTLHKELGQYIEVIIDRNEIVAKFFTLDAFLAGFDKGVAGEPSTVSKEELCKYFEPEIEVTPGRKVLYSEACGQYVVEILRQKGLTDADLQEVRAGIVEAQSMLEGPEFSDETKAKCIELLEDISET